MKFKTGEIIIDEKQKGPAKYRELFVYLIDSGNKYGWPAVIKIGTYVPSSYGTEWWASLYGRYDRTERVQISPRRAVVRPTTEELKKIMNAINEQKRFKYNIIKATLGHR